MKNNMYVHVVERPFEKIYTENTSEIVPYYTYEGLDVGSNGL